MSAANCPTVDHRNYHFWHKTDQPLNFQNIQSMTAVFSHISLMSTCFLIASATKCMTPVFRTWPFAGEQYYTDRGIFRSVVKSIVQFGSCFRAKCVAKFRPVDGNPGNT